MPRPRSIPDAQVLALVRAQFAAQGEKSVSFGTMGLATGLAPSSLAQRYGSVDGMLSAAALAGWDDLIVQAEAADHDGADKGPQGYLKRIDGTDVALLLSLGGRDARARERAAEWRRLVETGLARRMGQGEKAHAAAQTLFAAWQGQLLWDRAASGIKELARRLG